MPTTPKSPRLFFLDNLKVLLVMLVIIHHVGQAYGPTGGSWPISNPTRDPLLGYMFALNRSFFMSLFFMISGYFLPASLERKGTIRYIKERFVRLGIPILFFLIIVHALLGYFVLVYYNHQSALTFWHYYWHNYWGFNLQPGTSPMYTLGPLWFVSVLLVFSMLYILLHKLGQKFNSYLPKFKSCSANKILLITIVIVIPCSFLIRIWFPIDKWVNYVILAMAPSDMARDTAFFFLGIVAYRCNLFTTISRKQGFSWLATAIFLGIFYVAFRSEFGTLLFCRGGISWHALGFDIWETIYCSGMCIGLITLFREFGNWNNKFWGRLSQDAFGAYLLQLEVIVATQYFFVTVNLGPLNKFFLASLFAIPLTFLTSHLIRKIPGVTKII